MDIRGQKRSVPFRKRLLPCCGRSRSKRSRSKKLPNGPRSTKRPFILTMKRWMPLTAEMERQTVQLVCRQYGRRTAAAGYAGGFVREIFANLQQATDYLGVVPASAMNRFTQHLRDAVLEQIKSDNIEPSQYENVGAILIFVMNGLSGLLNTDAKLAQKQIDVIAAVVADGWCPWSSSFPLEPKQAARSIFRSLFLLLQLIFLRNYPAPLAGLCCPPHGFNDSRRSDQTAWHSPFCHSKLSIRLQWKYPFTGIPSAMQCCTPSSACRINATRRVSSAVAMPFRSRSVRP